MLQHPELSSVICLAHGSRLGGSFKGSCVCFHGIGGYPWRGLGGCKRSPALRNSKSVHEASYSQAGTDSVQVFNACTMSFTLHNQP